MAAFLLPPESAESAEFWRSLTDEGIDACARIEPEHALRHVAQMLSDARFAWCTQRAPESALRAAPERIPGSMFDELVRLMPASVAATAARRLAPAHIRAIAERAPAEAVAYLGGQLTKDELRECARRAPLECLQHAYDRFDPQAQRDLVERCWAKPSWRPLVVMAAGGAVSEGQIEEFVADDSLSVSARTQALLLGCPDRLVDQAVMAKACQYHPALALVTLGDRLPEALVQRVHQQIDIEDLEKSAAHLRGRMPVAAIEAAIDVACARWRMAEGIYEAGVGRTAPSARAPHA